MFDDLNGNGVQDGTEPGIGGVTVSLLDDTGAPILNAGVPVTTSTASNGTYSFTNLLADDYQVEVTTTDLPVNAAFTTAGDDNQAVTVPVAATPATVVDIDTVDFGVQGDLTVGDTVYLDADADGTQDADEQAGIAGVTVELVQNGAVIATDVTDIAGNYEFANLLAGDYTVRIDIGTIPVGTLPTTPASITRTVTADDDTFDVGIVGSASIGDTVYLDADEDQIQSGTIETGVVGVTVILTDGAGNQVATQTTAAGGAYDFTNLPAGTYEVTVDPTGIPNGAEYTVTTPDPRSVTVATGDDENDADIGINALGSVAGTVFVDLNENGTQVGAGEDGQVGVTVSLVDPTTGAVLIDPAGNPLTDVTDASGDYTITDVPAGDYEVRVDTVTLPAGSVLVAATPNDVAVTVARGRGRDRHRLRHHRPRLDRRHDLRRPERVREHTRRR